MRSLLRLSWCANASIFFRALRSVISLDSRPEEKDNCNLIKLFGYHRANFWYLNWALNIMEYLYYDLPRPADWRWLPIPAEPLFPPKPPIPPIAEPENPPPLTSADTKCPIAEAPP